MVILADFDPTRRDLFGLLGGGREKWPWDGHGNSVLQDDSISPISDHAPTGSSIWPACSEKGCRGARHPVAAPHAARRCAFQEEYKEGN
jgi:hypothetical protein